MTKPDNQRVAEWWGYKYDPSLAVDANGPFWRVPDGRPQLMLDYCPSMQTEQAMVGIKDKLAELGYDFNSSYSQIDSEHYFNFGCLSHTFSGAGKTEMAAVYNAVLAYLLKKGDTK